MDTDFTLAHRQRLVELARGKPHMDIAFHAFLQCDENVCKKMRAHYGQGSSVHQMDNFDYKFLMSIDGNTFVSRLPLFLSSGSVAFRAGLYSEWFDEWVRPGVHYLQASPCCNMSRFMHDHPAVDPSHGCARGLVLIGSLWGDVVPV